MGTCRIRDLKDWIMAEADHLKELKSAARKVARARRIKHVGALEVVAMALGYPHWKAVATAEKKGWRPGAAEIAIAEALVEAENPLISIDVDPVDAMSPESFEGSLMGHAYTVSTEFDDVLMWGHGWEIKLPEPPLAPARYRNTDKRLAANPLDDVEFKAAATLIAKDWQKRIHARIASDWPRRSTVPDADGFAQHPLFGDLSKEWFCMHCDRESTAAEVAGNLFHCPECMASPIDIHASPWWMGDDEAA